MTGLLPNSMRQAGCVMDPLRAAALHERGQLDDRSLPMLAAHWLAEGRSGEALLELASLSGGEREVTELWPLVLAELDAGPPTAHRRDAMAWGAGLVVSGDRETRWLVRLIWPVPDDHGDPDLDELVYTIDDWLDWTARDLRSRRPVATRVRAEAALAALGRSVTAMSRGDVRGALAELTGLDR